MEQQFRKYINSVLNPDEFLQVSEFLANKKNEEVIYKLMKPFWEKSLKEESESENPNPELRNKIFQALLTSETKKTKRNLEIYNTSIRIAAILIVGLIISTFFFFRKSGKEQFTADLQTINTPFGAKTNFTLPDGSTVWLNSGSSLSFYSKFGKTRFVNLKGEAYFEVKKDGKPFIVVTKYGDVEVKGTVFNVKAFSGENFQTTLLKGSVKVLDKANHKEATLKPGQQSEFSDKEIKVEDVDTELYSSWKDGKLIFRDEYLPSVTKRLERWYNVKIELANDKRLSEISYTGTIEMESFSEVLQLLKVTAPITYNYNESTRTIRIEYLKHK